MAEYVYNDAKDIRTKCELEILYKTWRANFIAVLRDVEYLNTSGEWTSQGMRWLPSESSIKEVMSNGFKDFNQV